MHSYVTKYSKLYKQSSLNQVVDPEKKTCLSMSNILFLPKIYSQNIF